MKRFVLLACMLSLVCGAYAQNEETIFSGHAVHGWDVGMALKFTRINGDWGTMAGFKSAWIVNHTFSLGFAGYGLATIVNADGAAYVGRNLEVCYGGLNMEYTLASKKLLHLKCGVLFGAGATVPGYRKYSWEFFDTCGYDHDSWGGVDWRNADVFFVAEPEINVELNVVRWFRIAGGVSYRFVAGVDHEWTSNSRLSGLAATVSFNFGHF